MLRLPLPATDPIALADWMELSAVMSRDRNYSAGDLERVLRPAGVLEASTTELDALPDDVDSPSRDGVERKSLEVFAELEARQTAAGASYPFRVAGGLVQFQGNLREFSAYLFCLCLSYSKFSHGARNHRFPRRLFEDLAVIAARNYVGGEAARFASPRTDLPGSFRPALRELCSRMKDGAEHRHQPARAGQDRTLDIVAWKDSPDKLAGKLLLFGQCASGHNWEGKLAELQPPAFCAMWFQPLPYSPITKAFFVPHRVNLKRWESIHRSGGIFFDRCRLSYWVHTRLADLTQTRDLVRWSNEAIRDLRA
jgi:hypothetical protein